MTEKSHSFEIRAANEQHTETLLAAAALINGYAEQGLMISVSLEQLQQMAAQGLLAIASNEKGKVIGTAGITLIYPDGKKEFGAWAVDPSAQKSGIGKKLLEAVLKKAPNETIIAFANQNSGPIFEKLGAPKLKQTEMHSQAFEPCKSCKCLGKESLSSGHLCVDTIFNLSALNHQHAESECV